MWFHNLIDVTEFSVKGSDQDIYIRFSASEMSKCSYVAYFYLKTNYFMNYSYNIYTLIGSI